MKSPLEQLGELETLIRELHKIDSKLYSGQFILAWRDNRKLIAALERRKENIIQISKEDKNNSCTSKLIDATISEVN